MTLENHLIVSPEQQFAEAQRLLTSGEEYSINEGVKRLQRLVGSENLIQTIITILNKSRISNNEDLPH